VNLTATPLCEVIALNVPPAGLTLQLTPAPSLTLAVSDSA
jgi:hypothetical protein